MIDDLTMQNSHLQASQEKRKKNVEPYNDYNSDQQNSENFNHIQGHNVALYQLIKL